MSIAPMPFEWDGEAMKPLHHFRRAADKAFVIGEVYTLCEHHDRSIASHNHFFASVSEAWKNLPEHLVERFPTAEHLRAYALIKSGFADSQTFVANSRTQAVQLAAFLRPIDPFSVVTIEGSTVTRWTAQSQSMRAMGKQRFQESKDGVLTVLAGLIDVTRQQLDSNAGTAA